MVESGRGRLAQGHEATLRRSVAGARAGLAGLALAAASPAFGCGYCIEDRVAAVYDHAVVNAALDQHHQIAFLAIEGPLPASAELRRVLARALAFAQGIDSRSLRVSVNSAALSLAYNGKRISADQIVDTLNRKLAARGLGVSLMKVMGPL